MCSIGLVKFNWVTGVYREQYKEQIPISTKEGYNNRVDIINSTEDVKGLFTHLILH